MLQNNNGQFFTGVVEDRNDPLMAGRVKVRVVGLHTHDKVELPTDDLPWAMVMQSANATHGMGSVLSGPLEGTTVIVIFHDWPKCQQPIVIGSIGGVPQAELVNIDKKEDVPLYKDAITPAGRKLPTSSAEVTGFQLGPITEENRLLTQLVLDSTAFNSTNLGLIDNLVKGNALQYGAVGGLVDAQGGIGSTYGGPQNSFESFTLKTGNIDKAVDEIKSGAADRLIDLTGFIRTTESTPFTSISSLFAEGISGVQNLFTLGITPASFGIVTEITTQPDQLASVPITSAINLNSSTSNLALQSISSLSLFTSSTTTADLDSSQFEKVGEGKSPSLYGEFGGPNFAGESAKIELPKSVQIYEGGAAGEIPTTPPSMWRGNRSVAEANIKILLAAAQKHGLRTNEQKAAFLAICGAESNWKPVRESAQYSTPDNLAKTFPTTFIGKPNSAELINSFTNWIKDNKGSREDFFKFVYAPSNNGRKVGNTQPDDGARFYGRGFIQLTGRANYFRYAELSGYPIDQNPDLLVTDTMISAEVAALYFLDRVQGVAPTSHPGYFYAARKAVGNNSTRDNLKKLQYYEHFYRIPAPESYGYAQKEAGNAESPYSFNGVLSGNKQGKSSLDGFKDPNFKYPLKRHIAEPETNRLARGQTKETIVPLKESQRALGIPIANKQGTWDQPSIPFAAKYPYNNVTETESGHIQEWDDTPGYERIHTYHRSGTFTEIDAQGTEVHKIVGDGYVIYDRNGFISVFGNANLTVAGNVNIYCRSDANIEVEGTAEMNVHGNFNIGVAQDMNIAVEGNFSMWANGAMNLQAKKKGHILSEDNLYISSSKQAHVWSNEEMYLTSLKPMHLRTDEDLYLLGGKTTHVNSGEDMYLLSGKMMHLKSVDLMHLDGLKIYKNSGTAQTASEAAESTKALIHGMIPPPIGAPIYPKVEELIPPPISGDDNFMFEIPEETSVKINKDIITEQTAQDGVSNTYESAIEKGVGGVTTIVAVPKVSEILATETFTADYRLSEHFTLGMLFDGGFNVKHKLVDQNGLTKQQIVANMSMLCENVLEKYLSVLPGGIAGYGKQWRITSGYRMGTGRSDHFRGRAVDISLWPHTSDRKERHFELIKELDKLVPYDQMILEYRGKSQNWIHTGFRGNDDITTFGGGLNRRQRFTMVNDKTYGQGFVLLA